MFSGIDQSTQISYLFLGGLIILLPAFLVLRRMSPGAEKTSCLRVVLSLTLLIMVGLLAIFFLPQWLMLRLVQFIAVLLTVAVVSTHQYWLYQWWLQRGAIGWDKHGVELAITQRVTFFMIALFSFFASGIGALSLYIGPFDLLTFLQLILFFSFGWHYAMLTAVPVKLTTQGIFTYPGLLPWSAIHTCRWQAAPANVLEVEIKENQRYLRFTFGPTPRFSVSADDRAKVERILEQNLPYGVIVPLVSKARGSTVPSPE